MCLKGCWKRFGYYWVFHVSRNRTDTTPYEYDIRHHGTEWSLRYLSGFRKSDRACLLYMSWNWYTRREGEEGCSGTTMNRIGHEYKVTRRRTQWERWRWRPLYHIRSTRSWSESHTRGDECPHDDQSHPRRGSSLSGKRDSSSYIWEKVHQDSSWDEPRNDHYASMRRDSACLKYCTSMRHPLSYRDRDSETPFTRRKKALWSTLRARVMKEMRKRISRKNFWVRSHECFDDSGRIIVL